MRWLAFAIVLGCHHAPAPVEPADKPPLPPASGTPIGFLIDDAGELKLTNDQLVKLRDIDASLASELDVIDAQAREANRPHDPDAAAQPTTGRRGGRGRGMSGGGMGGGGMGGGGPAGGAGGRRSRSSGSGASTTSPSIAPASGKLAEQRTADVRDALRRTFALLDPAQQETAKKVLADHDVDLDTGGATSHAPPPGESSDGDAPGSPDVPGEP